MINAIVIDDEILACKLICKFLKDTGNINILGYFTNPKEALKNIALFNPDVIFVDIQMPEISGLELAEQVYSEEYNCEIVFVTAYDKYALEAFKVNAFDYLMKPVSNIELNNTIERLIKRREISNVQNVKKNNTQIKVNLFGNYTVVTQDNFTQIKWFTAKCGELFAFMLLQNRNVEIPKWSIIESLWHDKDERRGDTNLRSTICRLNKTFREYDVKIKIVSMRNSYLLKAENLMVDAYRLEKLALQEENQETIDIKEYEDVVLNYHGELLEYFDYDWCENHRELYNRYFISVASKLLYKYLEINKNPLNVLNLAELILKHDPYNEPIHEVALKLHFEIGGSKKAEVYYNTLFKSMKDELGISPNKSLIQLYKNLT